MDDNKRLVALVTGASSGIGVCYAAELAQKGFNVILISNQVSEVKDVAANIAQQTNSENCSFLVETDKDENIRLVGQLPIDRQWIVGLYKNLAVDNAAQKVFDFYPHIDILINNAGVFFFNDVINCDMSRIETIINLHIMTVTKLCRLYGEEMRNKRKGYILNMSSISVHTPFPGISLYTATKSYIHTFTKAFHYEMRECGVNVMVVSPGAVATDLYRLPKNLQKLGVQLGIIYKPEKLAHKAIYKLFKGRQEFIPGAINHLFKPIYMMLPTVFKMWVRKKVKFMMK
ncbi:MAG: SDR family NAD(P)-dependent oxidoreductase [Rikenellaceae bacterium]